MKSFRYLRSKWSKFVASVFAIALVVFGFQNCGKVRVNPLASTGEFSSNGFPMQMRAPTQFPISKRYIMLVDMSNSMISGPCPFDMDVNPTVHGQSGPYYEWDPNPLKNDPRASIADQRGQARDCSVDVNLQAPNMFIDPATQSTSWTKIFRHKTFIGADPDKHRFTIVREWIKQLRENLPADAQSRVQVLIWPVNGGASMVKMVKKLGLKKEFFDLNKTTGSTLQTDKILGDLEIIHNDELNLRKMDIVDRWNTILSLDSTASPLEQQMGTTALGDTLTDIYDAVNNNFNLLALDGAVTSADFSVLLFGDGHVTPIKDTFDKVMTMWDGCNCYGSACAGACSEMWGVAKQAWGDPEANKIESVDFRLSMLQSLPRFYGGGFLDVHFLRLLTNEQYKKIYTTTNDKNAFDSLTEMSEARNATVKNWTVTPGNIPFDLASSASQITTFKMTHLFIMNSNVRLGIDGKLKPDSDGDGLPDDEEAAAGLSPSNIRSTGYCLDSIYANTVYRPKCAALAESQGCDPKLDSDGDSLNECDEMVLGTDPFDFDTDGDAIPDTLEWIYGYNPLRADTELDTNGDGIVNMINFAASLPPQVDPREVPATGKTQYQVNALEPSVIQDHALGSVRVDQFDVRIQGIPSYRIQPVDPNTQPPLYLNRLGIVGLDPAKVYIPVKHRLIKSIADIKSNMLFGILRTVDPDQPERVFWQMLELPFSLTKLNTNQQLDLSRFEQIRVMDRHGMGK